MRITLRDAQSKGLLSKVQVKVIGSDNPQFISGATDLRGVFVADGVRGMVTAVARKGDLEYAFYRGTTYLGHELPVARGEGEQGGEAAAQAPAPAGGQAGQALDSTLKTQNEANSAKQINRLQQRFNQAPQLRKGAPAGGFR